MAEAGHFFVLVGDGEAALRVRELALAELEHRVDQPEQTFTLLLRLLALGGGALIHVHGNHVEVHADLRSREPDAVGLVHRLRHVVAELANPGVDVADRLGLLLQAGVGPDDDFSQCHAFSLPGRPTGR